MAVEKSIERNADCFYLLGESLGFTNILQHSHIHTNDNVPIQDNTDFPSRKEKIDRQVKDLLDQNIIKPESSYNTPVWIVPKKARFERQQTMEDGIKFPLVKRKTIGDAYSFLNNGHSRSIRWCQNTSRFSA